MTDTPPTPPADAPPTPPADAPPPDASPEDTPPFDADADPTPPRPPRPTGPVQYRGADLEPARGPGLGCFRIQLVVLVVLIIVTPLSVTADAPDWLSAVLLFTTLGLLLVSGQTIIFLLRLVAAERREGRRRPVAARTRTVGELEDAAVLAPAPADDATAAADEPAHESPAANPADDPAPAAPSDDGPPEGAGPPADDPVRQ